MDHTPRPKWSIITVTYNSSAKLKRYWRSAVPADVEWIVVDNASTDETVATARKLGASVLTLEANVGFSAANNIGLKAARGDYIAFVNPDASVAYESLDEIARVVDTTGGLVAPQLVNDDGTPQPNGRGIPRVISKINNRIRFSEKLKREYTIYAAPGEIKNVFWITGAVVCSTRVIFEDLGGWNEEYFLYFEDVDLCCRAHIKGIPVIVYGDVKWTHGWARDNASFKLRPWLHELKSAVKFYRKYPGLANGLFVSASRFSDVHANSSAVWTRSHSG